MKNKNFLISSKKGMGISQVFIFIVAAITFALIMIFGYKSISQFVSKGEDVAFVQFKTNLEKSVKQIRTEFASVRKITFNPPPKYQKICIVDLDSEYNPKLCKEDPIACDVWRDAYEESKESDKNGYELADENVFLTPVAPVKIKLSKLSFYQKVPTKGYLCHKILNGQFELILEGKGDRTEISMQQFEK